jgi:hypothetical protein
LSYLDGSLSSFPTNLDSFVQLLDLPVSQVTNAERYMVLRQKTRTSEEETEFQSLTTLLQDYILTPEVWNKFASCVYAVENFFKNSVEGYITTKQTEFDALIAQFTDKGTYDPAITYETMNFVHYSDDNVYIALQDSLNQTPSSSSTYWRTLSIKGDTGYGVGVTPQGNFSASTQYHVNDLVYYNANLYRCIVDSTGNYPTNENYFELFLAGNGETLSNLNTNNKTSLVGAINEVLDSGETPFKIKSATYTSGTDTLSITISSGSGETFNSTTINTITKTSDTTLNITPVTASTTYTIYLKNDGNFASSTDGTTSIGSITIGTVSTKSDKTVNTIVDKRPLVSGVGKKVSEHLADETQHVPYTISSGSTNTYAVTLNPAPTSLVAGMAIAVKINVDSTGASTININGLGAKAIKKANGTDVTNLKANGIYTLRYDGTNFILQGEGASGTATASDLLSGKTATTDAGEITGTITSKAAQTYTPGTANQTIAAGQYLAGIQTIKGDANLLATNILSGKSIFGVAGNAVDGSGMKKFASGTISRGSTTYSIQGYNNTSSSTYDKYVVTVSGLTFTPSTILVVDRTSSYTKPVIYQAAGVIKTANNNLHYICDEYYSYIIADAPMYVNSTGFCLPVGYTNTYYWYAFE